MEINVEEGQTVQIGEFNGNTIVNVKRFKGKAYVDIRKWFNTGSSLAPTKKGISIELIDVSTLIDLLSKVEELKAQGKLS